MPLTDLQRMAMGTLWLIIVCLGNPALSFGKQPETERLENLWGNKNYEELQLISEQRLVKNPNDPVGLILSINLAFSTDALPTETDPVIAALRAVAAHEQGWIKIVFDGYIGAALEFTSEDPEQRTQWRNRAVTHHSWGLIDMLLARQACQERIARQNPIDLEALWKTRQDVRLKEWANEQGRDELAAQLVNLDLNILEAEDVARLEARFKALLPRVEERRAEFSSRSDTDLVHGLRTYSMMFAVLRRPDQTINEAAEVWGNSRDIVPPGIRLANRLNRGC